MFLYRISREVRSAEGYATSGDPVFQRRVVAMMLTQLILLTMKVRSPLLMNEGERCRAA